MSNKPEKKQSGKVNYIWVLAGGYLIYLACKLLYGLTKEEIDQPLIAVIAAVLFIAVGAYTLLREWKAYKFGLDNIDDPDTWSDEEEDAQLEELMQSTKISPEDAEEDDVEEQV